MRPSSTGKGPGEYIAMATVKLDRDTFAKAVKEFAAKHQLAAKLEESQIQALYRLSVDHHRQVNAIQEIQRAKLIQDWDHRKKLIANTTAKLTAVHDTLRRAARDKKWPSSAEFADAVLARVKRFQRTLDREIVQTETRQRAQAAMLRALPLKTMRDTYVGELYLYIVRTFPGLLKKDQHALMAAAMCAAREFTPNEVAEDVLTRMPMMVSRAKKSLERENLDAWA